MMEEVSDDTNGESTFEFVGGKSDENILKDRSTFGPTEAEIQSPSSVLPSFYPATTPSQAEPTNVPAAQKPTSGISFYDPAQYSSANTILMTPFPLSTEAAPKPPPVSSPVQNQFVPISPPSEHGLFRPVISSLPPEAVTSPTYYPPQQHPVEPNRPECSIVLPGNEAAPMMMPESTGGEGGVWGWFKGTQFLNKVAEKAKSSVDSVITTLDPGMKEIINSGGDISVIVASGNEAKISAVREAFQLAFGKATVQGMAVQSSSIAPQPVGFSAGLKAAEERIGNLRQQGLQGNHVILAVENFIAELTPENWFDIGCLLLQDFSSGITLQVYTEAIPISSHFVSQAKDQTPADYPLGWSGHAITIGQIVGAALGVHHSDWHQALTGVSRREILFLAAKTIAGLYKARLRR